MKITILRFASLMLCVLLCLSAFAACRSKNPDAPNDGSNQESTNDGGEEITTSKPRPVLPPENIPPLNDNITNSTGDSLAGYTVEQLNGMWGFPIAELYGERGYVWELPDDYDYVIGYFDEEYYITEIHFFSVMKAIVLSVSDSTVSIAPAEGEKELSTVESFTLPLSDFRSSAHDKLAEGVTVYITYDGSITEDGRLSGVSYANTAKPSSQFARF